MEHDGDDGDDGDLRYPPNDRFEQYRYPHQKEFLRRFQEHMPNSSVADHTRDFLSHNLADKNYVSTAEWARQAVNHYNKTMCETASGIRGWFDSDSARNARCYRAKLNSYRHAEILNNALKEIGTRQDSMSDDP